MDIPLSKLFIDKLGDLFLFFHQKGNQSTLCWLECVLQIYHVVPQLSKWELTSSFLGEDVKIGVVTGGYKLLGSAHRFLGSWCLNLHLMDKFQAFVLSLLIKGCDVTSYPKTARQQAG